ncbi:hypothetical protein LSTR_LSTR008267 [Laodelphax striatellus]|uniref:Uncharacterized protein n=1 Tax=Laodelphax striatellus TaxID=195883 RepID=A0A482XLT9_LAOST|nr:hypothetical protein LSTR_LSTR008267 [Laodelphax striatellus]
MSDGLKIARNERPFLLTNNVLLRMSQIQSWLCVCVVSKEFNSNNWMSVRGREWRHFRPMRALENDVDSKNSSMSHMIKACSGGTTTKFGIRKLYAEE